MSKIPSKHDVNQRHLRRQYRTNENLQTRIQLHTHYSTNPIGWFPWVFDHMQIPEGGCVLQIGCGSGELWKLNQSKISEYWDIILTDYSEGMLKQAKACLQQYNNIRYRQVNAMDIPYDTHKFDVVIANHVLYHVKDINQALTEIIVRSEDIQCFMRP